MDYLPGTISFSCGCSVGVVYEDNPDLELHQDVDYTYKKRCADLPGIVINERMTTWCTCEFENSIEIVKTITSLVVLDHKKVVFTASWVKDIPF